MRCSPEIVFVGESVRPCVGGQMQYISYAAQGMSGRRSLGEDLKYYPDNSGNYHQDKVEKADGCILAARIRFSRKLPLLCEACPNVDLILADPIVREYLSDNPDLLKDA